MSVDKVFIELPNGLRVAHFNENETKFVYQEIFVERIYLKNGIQIKDGDCVLDVGANIGLFTLFVRELCKKTVVYAFEPIPPIYELLQENTKSPDFEVYTFPFGLSDRNGMAHFTFYPGYSILSGSHADAASDFGLLKTIFSKDLIRQHGISAERAAQFAEIALRGKTLSQSYDSALKTLSTVFREERIQRVDLLKIDVEKSEMSVLKGIGEGDWKKVRQIVLEVHGNNASVREISRFLEGKHFNLTPAEGSGPQESGIHMLYAIQNPLSS